MYQNYIDLRFNKNFVEKITKMHKICNNYFEFEYGITLKLRTGKYDKITKHLTYTRAFFCFSQGY